MSNQNTPQFTAEDVDKIAQLAQLAIEPDQKKKLIQDLSDILIWIQQLQSVQTEIQPLTHTTEDATQPLRIDQVTETIERSLLQRNAPKVNSGQYIVPRVVE